ncbi:MAG: efflux RND transporter permease subunit [Thermoguttaceae bacterium]|nr:efflux RND transporter permease subunit [Thermoguttaceae bacterium]
MSIETPASADRDSVFSEPFVIRHRKAILFLTAALCLAGGYAAYVMPASVFPQTDFPRVVILIDNGVMPADEMMATITRPVEEAMKNIPGTATIRSTTGRGSAAVNVFFDWSTDMIEAELYVLGRLAQIRSTLPPTAEFAVHRLTFSAFPIIGISLTSKTRDITDLWEKARYDLNPRFLRIKGVARVNIVGGRVPEYHVVVDPLRLEAYRLTIEQVSQALAETNNFTSAGMHEENRQLYLAVVDNRLRNPADIEDVVVAWSGESPVHVRDIASVRRGHAPQFNIVTAAGSEAVLMNIYGQPDSNTVAIAGALEKELKQIRQELPPDMKLAFFYDQSLFVREGVRSVWECIAIGLILSVIIHYLFLRSLSGAFVVGVGIPVTVLVTLVVMRVSHMSFNLMTLGGIAAAIGMVIDDAIVVVEAIHAKLVSGYTPSTAIRSMMREVGPALVGSTLTPVVVFIPLAFLDGVPGVFFRALALTMVSSLLISLLVAVTFTPALAQLLMRHRGRQTQDELAQGGRVLRIVIAAYEWVVRRALRHQWWALGSTVLVVVGGIMLYGRLETDFLPKMEEGAFVLDYYSRPGTSLSETNRMLRHVEQILLGTPEVESFSRRTGARLALAIAEPNTGDFLVKLRSSRRRTTEQVIDELREKIQAAEPALHTDFPGVLSDLIGDLTWSPKPCEIKIFSNDTEVLKQKAAEIAETIETIPGVVDVEPGLVVAGPSLRFAVRPEAAARVGLTAADIGNTLQTGLLGNASSYLLQGDRTVGIRVLSANETRDREMHILETPIRSPSGSVVTLHDVADAQYQPGILEMHREDLRQLVAVSARFAGMDLGTGIDNIQAQLDKTLQLPQGATLEFGGLYQQQQESFRNLAFVLLMAIVLVFAVLLVEFRSVIQPLAIVLGAVLALSGVVVALGVTGTSLNIVSFLGAIIGVGIVAKNGILMLDFVEHLQARGYSLFDSLVQSGRRRLRPVLMTSLATFIGLLPLAYGVGAGADMLRPLAIAIIGALFISLLLSLVVTPVFYYVMARLLRLDNRDAARAAMTIGESDGQANGRSDDQLHGVIHARVR